MNNKEFITKLADRCSMTPDEAQQNAESLISAMTDTLLAGTTISVSGFGVFEVRKKMERVSVNPVTGLHMLIPPKLTLNYKPSALLKAKIK